LNVFAAGDAKEIAEASSAMFNGKIAGLEIARTLGKEDKSVPEEWYEKADVLKSPPGPITKPPVNPSPETGFTPVIHCHQQIPCNPCVSVCKQGVIHIPGDSLLEKPQVVNSECIGCNKCLFVCPGLAISLVDYHEDQENPTVSLTYEVYNHEYKKGDTVLLTDYEGNRLQEAIVIDTVMGKTSKKTQIIKVQVPKGIAKQVAGFRIQKDEISLPKDEIKLDKISDDAIVCRCERITAGEIRKLFRLGVRDLNQIKAMTRAGMGACGGKTCEHLILQMFKEEGVHLEEITLNTMRPVFVEAPLGVFSNISYHKQAKRC
jgi:Fe-S-cluster-containing hydrogenase component 2/bacterioferritin-associated ferredoxin